MHAEALAGARVLALALVPALLCGGVEARERLAPRNLECGNIRRLADNFLLDLRIRMMFAPRERSYVRLENTGRGWQVVGSREYVAWEPTRVLLTDTPESLSYIERLTGDYYHLDRTGMGLSVWGRCVLVGGTARQF